jgi:hypothetical protein
MRFQSRARSLRSSSFWPTAVLADRDRGCAMMVGMAQNRVTPLGEIEAFPLRGAFTGNRGRLHEGRRIVRFHAGDLWIVCALHFNDRWSEQWLPCRFTWLFFYDESVALAAGHRPCGECRHTSYTAYREAWADAKASGRAPSSQEMNRQLHAERIVRGTHRRRLHPMSWRGVPDGTFVLHADAAPHLVCGSDLVEWTREGYTVRRRPARGQAIVITPPSSVAVLRAGYPVAIDATVPVVNARFATRAPIDDPARGRSDR